MSGGKAWISYPYFTVTLKSGVTLDSSLYRVSVYQEETSFQQLQTLNQYVSDGRLKTSKTPFYRNYTEYFDTVQVYSRGSYDNTVTFRLNSQWGTTKGIYVIELIDLIPEDLTPVAKPTFSGGSSFTYTGSTITPSVNNFETTYMTRSGTYQATNVGNYSITYTLKSGYCWNDDTTSDVVLNWYITKKSLRKPILRESPTYNGSEVSPSLYFFDDLLMTMSGDTSAINVNTSGTYTITITLKDTTNYQWSGGGIAVVNWNVNPQSIDDGTVTPPYTDYTYDGTVKNMIHRNRYRLFLLRLQMFNR